MSRYTGALLAVAALAPLTASAADRNCWFTATATASGILQWHLGTTIQCTSASEPTACRMPA